MALFSIPLTAYLITNQTEQFCVALEQNERIPPLSNHLWKLFFFLETFIFRKLTSLPIQTLTEECRSITANIKRWLECHDNSITLNIAFVFISDYRRKDIKWSLTSIYKSSKSTLLFLHTQLAFLKYEIEVVRIYVFFLKQWNSFFNLTCIWAISWKSCERHKRVQSCLKGQGSEPSTRPSHPNITGT